MMRLSIVSLLGLAIGPALAVPKIAQHLELERDFGTMLHAHSARGLPAIGKKGAMLMNRIGPSVSEIYVADADGGNERKLLGNSSRFEYHASFSPDGQWITFTSERNGDGNSDLYRARTDGSGLEKIVATPSVEDAGVLSPDGSKAAFVSTADGYLANIWVVDMATGSRRCLTNTNATAGSPESPDGHFRPSWSPDGEWIAFSSDRNTAWLGHDNGTGWEHTQQLSVYVIRPDGTGFRQLATEPGHCLGSPKWSPDGERVVFYDMVAQATWDAHRPESVADAVSQLVSVDFATGLDRIEHTSGSGLKMFPQFLSSTNIAYLVKGGTNEGLNYTSSNGSVAVPGEFHSPSWSPDGRSVVYEKSSFTPVRPMEKPLYSWDADWDYRFTDVFPHVSLDGRLVITQKQLGNSSIVTMRPDGLDETLVYDPTTAGLSNSSLVSQGLAGAFQPSWSPDGEWIAFGVGGWFTERDSANELIVRAKADGSYSEVLTDSSIRSGFPSYSADGRYLVYRVWGKAFGLRIMDLTDKSIRVLTNVTVATHDNLPYWSPDGERITYTCKTGPSNYDVCTIRPDGTDRQVLTTSGANDAHSVWTADGRILYSSGMYGFRDEAAIYDDAFQPYGQIFVMNADGSGKRMLTDSIWEDSMPLYLPNDLLY